MTASGEKQVAVLALVCCLAVASAHAAEPELLEQPPDDGGDRVGRVAAELGATLLGAVLPTLLFVPFVLNNSPNRTPFDVMFAVAMLAEPLSVSTATWLVHRKMKGQGLWPAALGGTLLGAFLGGGLFGVYGLVTNFQLPSHYTVLAGAGGVLLTVAGSVLAIELHHDSTLSTSVAPVPGGAMAFLSVRL